MSPLSHDMGFWPVFYSCTKTRNTSPAQANADRHGFYIHAQSARGADVSQKCAFSIRTSESCALPHVTTKLSITKRGVNHESNDVITKETLVLRDILRQLVLMQGASPSAWKQWFTRPLWRGVGRLRGIHGPLIFKKGSHEKLADFQMNPDLRLRIGSWEP